MWEMLDPDLECGNECGGPGPPPEFLVPPPPRPPFLAELVNCNEEQQLAQQSPFGASGPFADVDMCEAFPIIDASYHSGPSLQTSAMIVLCSVLLLFVIFISSLLVWKHKRKVQNFLPCKTPTRGPPHLDATGVSAAHSVTYEDPDVHLGHHPLVMRHHHHHHHHHNMELHAKQIHYPSGYPMPRSPPLFICSSPGPDPYRSHDNVYEELEHGPGRDTDSEPPIQSDDDFAEDELSLPGDRSFHKSPSDGGTTVATIYHDRSNGGGSSNSAATTASVSNGPATLEGLAGAASVPGAGGYLERNRTERNSLLSSSSSSGNDTNHPLHRAPAGITGAISGVASGSHSNGNISNTNNNININNNNGSNHGGSSSASSASNASHSNRNSSSSADCGNNNNNGPNNCSNNNNNNNSNSNSNGGLFRSRKHHPGTLGGSGRRAGPDPVVLPPSMYDDRGMMTLPPPAYNHTTPLHHNHHPHHHPHHLNGVNNNGHRGGAGGYYSTIDDGLDPVERRNRINAQLSASSGGSVSTIFRNGGVPRGAAYGARSRTNPRSSDRRTPRNGGPPQLAVISNSSGSSAGPQDPGQYIYHEPVFHEGLIYDGCLSHTYSDRSGGSGSTGTGSTGGVAYHHPYILPGGFSTFRHGSGHGGVGPAPGGAGTIYSRDSSFGSDSGYSQHTQTSGRSAIGGWTGSRRPTGSGQHLLPVGGGGAQKGVPSTEQTHSQPQQQQQQQQQQTSVANTPATGLVVDS
ncbi:dual specificity protein kinase splA [Anopheles nili]|uniref:dual specificity protein kinase splA n=1 Tax=Anopheles nili TaxID=185578 RepID=UPI00237AD6FB|nr:dual specificity protein kinase splA [Anopheles nili]